MTTAPAEYVRAMLGPRDPVLDEILRRSLIEHRMPTIQVDDNAGRILQLLTRLHRPEHVIEIGTLFGYSAIYIARGLSGDGRLTTVEIDPRAAALARANIERAGVADRVEIVVGDAKDCLASVSPDSVDMIFIDGDKASYPSYLKLGFPLLAKGGLLIADDAFAIGDLSPEGEPHDGVGAIHTYVRAITKSSRLFSAFIGTEHGLLVGYKE